MTVPGSGEAPTASTLGEVAQSRAEPDTDLLELTLSGDAFALDWQPELDSALEAIDSCLPVKRRRSIDPPGTPPFPRPEVSVLTFTPEILDALATRVADKLRPVEPIGRVPTAVEPPPLKAGAVVSIRFRWPLFSLTRGSRRSRARA